MTAVYVLDFEVAPHGFLEDCAELDELEHLVLRQNRTWRTQPPSRHGEVEKQRALRHEARALGFCGPQGQITRSLVALLRAEVGAAPV